MKLLIVMGLGEVHSRQRKSGMNGAFDVFEEQKDSWSVEK